MARPESERSIDMRKIILAAVLALAPAAASAASPAAGAWQVGNNAYHLYLSDLDLHAAAGRAEALARVELAARRVCRGAGVTADEKTCIARTIATSTRGSALEAIRQAVAEREGVRLAQGQVR